MSASTDYALQNAEYMNRIKQREGVVTLPCGVCYEILKQGQGTVHPSPRSIVSVYYKGMLINGKVFDSNMNDGCPAAFRLNTLIQGWQRALLLMRAGDEWKVYIPAELGYGKDRVPGIPKNSTLVFTVKLVSVA